MSALGQDGGGHGRQPQHGRMFLERPEGMDLADADGLRAAGLAQPHLSERDIVPLFRARDRQSMSFAFDLWSYGDVRARAADIARRLHDGTMPCDGTWSAARVEVFQRWADTGLQP